MPGRRAILSLVVLAPLVDAFSTVWFLDLAAAGELEAYQEVGEDDDE